MSSRNLRTVFAGGCLTVLVAFNACDTPPASVPAALAGGNADRGKVAIQHYGCNACHAIAGLPDPSFIAAAPITKVTDRSYIAGVLPVTPENLILWIRFPRKVKPASAMPNLDVSATDARDIATYLYSLH